MGIGSLELRTRPLTVVIDTWPMRAADLGQRKPADFTAYVKVRGQAAALDAIGRIARDGDELARIEERGRPVVSQAERYFTDRAVTTDDLSVRFLTPPAIAWRGGGVEMRYRAPLDLRI